MLPPAQARREAIYQAQLELRRRPVYLDTETTGLGPAAEIVEIGLVADAGETLFESFVQPAGPVSPEARRVHQITDAQLAAAPAWPAVWPQVQALLEGQRLAIYNAEFDLRLMRQSHQQHGLSWTWPTQNTVCIMQLYAQFYGQWDARKSGYRWQSLESAGQQCGLTLRNDHRACADARLARAVLHYLAEAH